MQAVGRPGLLRDALLLATQTSSQLSWGLLTDVLNIPAYADLVRSNVHLAHIS